ncbi:MAG: hypothetical protein ABR587_11485 [Candidatus Binatia bacterium]
MGRGAVLLVAVIVGWAGSYASGVWPWIGYAWLERSSFGAGNIRIIGEDRVGTQLGFDNFVFFEGQEIVIEYDVEIRRGSLWFHVFQPFDGKLGDGTTHYVTTSGRGTWTMPVTKTGYYHVTIEPSVTRGPGVGFEMGYTAKWGARPRTR